MGRKIAILAQVPRDPVSAERRIPEQFAGRYRCRPLFGASFRTVVVARLADLPPHQRLIAALLRDDGAEAGRLIETSGDRLADGFCFDPATGALPALLYARLVESRLSESFSRLRTSDGSDALALIRNAAADASVKHARFNEFLGELLGITAGLRVLFLKGTVFARSLYDEPQQRLSQDFDLLVAQDEAAVVVERLTTAGFRVEWRDPGHCHQAGVGPSGSLENLSLRPSPLLAPCHNLTLRREGWPYVELKFDPLETGMRMRELDRLFADARAIEWDGCSLPAPDLLDHLLLSLTHLHKHGFLGWMWLYDIHLMAPRIAGDEALWGELARRSAVEGVEASAWAALDLARDRLSTPVPDWLLERLAPPSRNPLRRQLAYCVSTEFLWNSASLPMLALNAWLLGDGQRKRSALRQVICPSSSFLESYYAGGRHVSRWQRPFVLMLHWLVVLLPGGLVRRTFGRLFWKAPG